MALSGSFKINSAVSYMWILVNWSASQNIGANKSTIKMDVYVQRSSGYAFNLTGNTLTMAIDGNNQNVAGVTFDLRNTNSQLIGSRSHTVNHNSDGSKTTSIGVNFPTGISAGTINNTVSISLNTIPRASSMAWDSSTFPHTFGKATAMNVSSAVGSFYHSVEFRLNGTLLGAPLVNSQGGGRKTFSIPLDWVSQLTNTTISNCSFRLITHTKPSSYASDSLIGYVDYSGQVSVPNDLVPVINSITYADQNTSVVSMTGSNQILLQGLSIPEMNVQTTLSYGSKIVEYKFEFNGKILTHNGYTYNIDLSANVNWYGSQVVKVTVKDARGRTATLSDTLDIRPYAPPSLTDFSAVRDTSTTTTIIVRKTAVVSSIKNGTVEKNPYTIVTRIKKSNATAWSTVKTETNSNSNFNLTGYAVDSSYDLEITIKDQLNSTVIISSVSTAKVLMDLYRDVGVGIGKMYEEGHGSLDVGDMIYMMGKSLLNTFYPVGTVYQSTNSANPSTFMGGTWERYGKGTVLVSLDESDSSFSTVNQTGGEKTHKLTGSELPKISGSILFHGAGSIGTALAGTSGVMSLGSKIDNKYHTNATTTGATSYGSANISFGSDTPHNNLQPYTTVYTWRRTA